MAPLVVKNRVLVGASGGEFGIHGWVKALDLETGKIVWTAYNVGPDAEMLAKPGQFKPFYDAARISASPRGPRTRGRTAARRSGAGFIRLRRSTSSTTAPAIPAPYNPEQRAGRQQVDHERAGAPARRRLARLGLPVHAARQLGLRLQRRDDPRRSRRSAASRARSWSISTRTASPTPSTARPAKCSSPSRSCTSTGRRRSTSRRGRPVSTRRKLTGASQGNVKDICPSLEGGKSPARRPRTRRAPASSTSPPTTSAWTIRLTQAAHIRGTPYIGANTPYYRRPGRLPWARSSRGTLPRARGLGDPGEISGLERRGRDRGRRRVLRHARRLVQGGRREDRHGALEVQGRVRASWARRSRTADRTASSTWRSMPASAATGPCSRETSAPTIRPTCARRPTSRAIWRDTRARGLVGSSVSNAPHVVR